MVVSFQADLPTGPVVVVSFALVLIAAFIVRALMRGRRSDEPAGDSP
ncbi:MAG: hypothetical protein ACE1ZF_01515 [Gemmatimonadales bacterium]